MKSCRSLVGNSFEGCRPPFKTQRDMLRRALVWVHESGILLQAALTNMGRLCTTIKPTRFDSIQDYAAYLAKHMDITPQIVVPPVEFSDNEEFLASIHKNDQVKLLYVASELLKKQGLLLEYVISIDLRRLGRANRTALNSSHECRLLTDASNHFVCQVRAVLSRLRKTIHMIRALTGDTRPYEKTPTVRYIRLLGGNGQRYILGVVSKTSDVLQRVHGVLSALLLGVGEKIYDRKDVPCALLPYRLDPAETRKPVGELVVVNQDAPSQELIADLRETYHRVRKVEPKYPVDSGAYMLLPELLDTKIAKRVPEGVPKSISADDKQPMAVDTPEEALSLPTVKCQKYWSSPANVLYLGCNRYSDKRPIRLLPDLFKDFKTPAPNHYRPVLPAQGPFFTLKKHLPAITQSTNPDIRLLAIPDKPKYVNRRPELIRLSKRDIARREKLLVGEWYDYQRRHRYFPHKFKHFASNRIVKHRVIRYPPNIDYSHLAHNFPDRAMPTAPSSLPVFVKTLVLP